MTQIKNLILVLVAILIFTPIYSQSEMKNNLINDWISTTKIFETGDTIQSANEELTLKKDGTMQMKERGMALPGKWKYLEDKNQLELILNIGEKSETIMLFIDKNTGQDLILTQKRGERFKTVMYVIKKPN